MPLRFTFRQLEYFVAVGEAGSIAAASDKVNVSSPSISAQIAQLEQEFGIQLFVRHHAQGLSLTPGGRRIFNEAKRVLDLAASLHDLARDTHNLPRGPLTIGCMITLAPLIAAGLRRSFESKYPDAKVTLTEADHATLLERLRRAEIDVALTYDLDVPQDISFDGMTNLPPAVMVAEDHPLASRSSVDLAEICDEPLVLLDLPHSREYFLSMFHNRGLKPNIAERTRELSVARSLVANGFGYGLINVRTATPLAPDGKLLRFLELEGENRPMVLGIATMRSAFVPRIVAAFTEHMRARLSAGDVPGMVRPHWAAH